MDEEPPDRTRRDVLRSGGALMAGGLGSLATDGEPHPQWEGDLPPDAQRLADGRIAIPLRRPSPPWFTDEVEEKTAAAAEDGMAYDIRSDTPVPPTNYTALRPGAWMVSPAWCTLNFVYGNSEFIGIAGHCADAGDRVRVVLAEGVVADIGTVTDDAHTGVGCDWGFVDIRGYDGPVDPTTALVGGPESSDAGTPDSNAKFVGHAAGMGSGGTPRFGRYQRNENVKTTLEEDGCGQDAFLVVGPSAQGDSGSPVLTTGRENGDDASRPIGILTHLLVGTQGETIGGTLIENIDKTPDTSEWDVNDYI